MLYYVIAFSLIDEFLEVLELLLEHSVLFVLVDALDHFLLWCFFLFFGSLFLLERHLLFMVEIVRVGRFDI